MFVCKGDYYFSISASDPQGNKSKNKLFHITVTKATPKFAITTADVSTPENADKVINLTTNRGGADFLIAGGAELTL
jgi:hypothetical protein